MAGSRRSERNVPRSHVGLRVNRFAALTLALGLAVAVGSCSDAPKKGRRRHHQPSAVPQETYASIVTKQRAVAATYETVTVAQYGTSAAGRPLTLVKVGRKVTGSTPRPAVLLTGVVHGDEYLGIVDKLPGELLGDPKTYSRTHDFLDRGGLIYLIPIVNPDGYERVRRENENGKDLNRNFDVRRYVTKLAQAQRGDLVLSLEDLSELAAYVNGPKLTEPESRALAEAMKVELSQSNAKLKLTIDYHCCQEDTRGALIHEWGDTLALRDGTISSTDVARYERAAALFATNFPGNLFGSGLETIGYVVFGSTDEWLYETFAADGVLSFTYEGQGQREDTRFRQHATFVDALLGEPELR